MITRTGRHFGFGKLAAGGALALSLLAGTAAAGEPRTIFTFEDYNGAYADTDVVVGPDGSLYGMTVKGGDFNGGTVFQLLPTGAGGWTHVTLHHFTGGPDGGQPYGGVTLDAAGNVYGTTVIGGSGGPCVEDGCGTVFQIRNNGDGSWTHKVIHDFTGGTDGFGAGGPVTLDNRGNVYGVTPTGGEYGMGTIFQVRPEPNGEWTETVIHHFTGGDDGGTGFAGRLLIDNNRTIYGVATVGGAFGVGTVYQLTPAAGGGFTFTTLYAFKGQPDGVFPYGGVVRDAAGNFYGTTYYGGTDGIGVVYRLQLRNGAWTATVLHSFKGGADGASPISTLAFGQDGHLYGTTSEGGTANRGTLFKLTPGPGGTWTESVLYSFKSLPDGAYPYAGLIPDGNGTFFGATVFGGPSDDGTIFSFAP
jgi:uncharacterized repeat protein (TIGR03803 family)